jgi:hypothetical protein
MKPTPIVEQRITPTPKLSDAEEVEMQHYVTRVYARS